MATSSSNKLTPAELKMMMTNLSDPIWRLKNLYYIKDKKGRKTLFQPNAEQETLLNEMWYFNIIPKARQLGITTFFCIYYLDKILFSSNKTAAIVAHTREQARKIFKDKIKFAYDNLEPWVKNAIGTPTIDTAQELTFPNGSQIFVGTSTRGSAIQYLHISEFGFTCQHFPDKAEEVVTGSINSVQSGQMVSIESTAEGKEGYFYQFCQEALNAKLENRSLAPEEFKIFFFPWWQHPEYQNTSGHVIISKEEEAYFQELKYKHNINLTVAQKEWYVLKRRKNQDKMFNQYPSTIDEAFSASVQGAYYATQMQRVYQDKRIRPVPYDNRYPVDTFWDLGMNDDNVTLFVQFIGNEIRIIDTYHNSGEGLAHYVQMLKNKPYTYGHHTFPHDINVRSLSTGDMRKKTLLDLGLSDIRVAPKPTIQEGIERTRSLFSRFYFDDIKTKPLYESLANYRKEWDAKTGVFKDTPRHDKNSHYADAMRVLAISYGEHLDNPYIEDQESNRYMNQLKSTNFFDE